MKNMIAAFLCCISMSGFACSSASSTDDVTFCSSFKDVATCHCTSTGLPKGLCNNMKSLYSRMLIIFGSLEKACAYQHNTSEQECIDDWNCYMRGGVDSQGKSCSSTQLPCE